jgi:tetratricopeptide (TPR) repeat protein
MRSRLIASVMLVGIISIWSLRLASLADTTSHYDAFVYDAFNEGNACALKGQYQKAIDNYSKAISLDPDYDAKAYCDHGIKAYRNRGIMYGELGQFEKAIDDYDKAISLDSKDESAYVNRAWLILP